MALNNAPFGFRPLRHMSGGLIRAEEYTIASAYGTSIYSGDAVVAVSDGTIAASAAGNRILGIFGGCQYVASDGSIVFSAYWPASTATQSGSTIKALVYTDPMITYEVQSAGTPTLTNVFNLADHVVGSGSTVTGQSGSTLSGTMSTADAGFRILRIIDRPGNSGIYARLEVQIFEHEFSRDDAATPGV